MVFMPGPIFDAVEHCRQNSVGPAEVVLLSPQGVTWCQETAGQFAGLPHVVLICGRYEGVDQRVVDHLVTREISVGDFVLTGGEIPAMVLVDSVTRLLPGALGKEESRENESFSTGMLDCPHYTRPAEFRGMPVPQVLLSGDHARIAEWRRRMALEKTALRRPELLERGRSQN